jgi:2,4-dienoyl-CoA reductase-like NADH-dependent reductase (Old Yellow Enzyme family)
MDGETIRYSKEEIEEMKQDYIAAIRRALGDWLV